MLDIVFPEKNEAEFIEMAKRLGYDSLCFVYRTEIPENLPDAKGISICTAALDNEKLKADFYFSQDIKTIREKIEGARFKLFFSLEAHSEPDFIHHRNSKMNQVFANIASEKDKIIAFDFNAILNSLGIVRARYLGRMMLNVSLCRKYKVKMCLASFAKSPFEMRAPMDLMSFGRILGMSGEEVRNAFSSL